MEESTVTIINWDEWRNSLVIMYTLCQSLPGHWICQPRQGEPEKLLGNPCYLAWTSPELHLFDRLAQQLTLGTEMCMPGNSDKDRAYQLAWKVMKGQEAVETVKQSVTNSHASYRYKFLCYVVKFHSPRKFLTSWVSHKHLVYTLCSNNKTKWRFISCTWRCAD